MLTTPMAYGTPLYSLLSFQAGFVSLIMYIDVFEHIKQGEYCQEYLFRPTGQFPLPLKKKFIW